MSIDGEMRYTGVELVNRKHVIPEYGVIIREQSDEWRLGMPYREGPMADWVVEAGKPKDLGLYLKAATQTIPKKNMLAYWDQFGEIFGMPIRIAKTTARDPKDRSQIENMLASMGAAAGDCFLTELTSTSRRRHGAMPSTSMTNVLIVPTRNCQKVS